MSEVGEARVSEVAVIGAGYVGLTTAACFAHLGHRVVCADVDEAKVEGLRAGRIPIHEHRLDELVREGLDSGRLSFTTDSAAAAGAAEFVFLCVPTPQRGDGSADLSFIEAACATISADLRPEAVVINKSTVPVGSARLVEQALGRPDVSVVSNPEFLREGTAVNDFLHPDRIVIGADDRSAAVRVAALFMGIPAPFMVTDPASAETIKYASNAFLATKLSFVNAIAALCEAVGADVDDVVLGMGYDRRIGHEFLRPGPGWGGSCFPKDTRALLYLAREAGYDFDLLDGVISVNEEQFERVVGKVARVLGGGSALEGARVAVWGLTFKAGTDDVRDSPAVEIANRLAARGARIVAFDPAVGVALPSAPGVEVVDDPYAACEGADVLVVLTEWDELKWLDLDKVHAALAHPRVVDARNHLDRAALTRRGFTVEGIG